MQFGKMRGDRTIRFEDSMRREEEEKKVTMNLVSIWRERDNRLKRMRSLLYGFIV